MTLLTPLIRSSTYDDVLLICCIASFLAFDYGDSYVYGFHAVLSAVLQSFSAEDLWIIPTF